MIPPHLVLAMPDLLAGSSRQCRYSRNTARRRVRPPSSSGRFSVLFVVLKWRGAIGRRDATGHLAPAAVADALVLGILRDGRGADRRSVRTGTSSPVLRQVPAKVGFVRCFIGLTLDGITAVPALLAHRVAFFLDEFGQLGRMDRLADSITLLRGYGAQIWVFVQDLSTAQGGVFPRLTKLSGQYVAAVFRDPDYDTARYLGRSGAADHQP